MLNKGQSMVVNALIDYINDNYQFEGKYRLAFDELQTSKNSICLTTSSETAPYEKIADVTGTAYTGTVTLAIVYRVMKTEKGIQDLEHIGVVDSLYDFIKANYKSVKSEDFFIDKITQNSGGKLDATYSGGIKDFRGIFTLNYERMASV